MARGPCTFKQIDVMRAMRAVREAGEEVQGVEFYRDGRFKILTAANAPTSPADDLDRELAAFEARHGQN
ncbi:MAG TPA: hypothetical protein PKD49_05755 [Hyphomicrobium sp.]|nr:hypothetical protein [Hyphomicrobium sp.]